MGYNCYDGARDFARAGREEGKHRSLCHIGTLNVNASGNVNIASSATERRRMQTQAAGSRAPSVAKPPVSDLVAALRSRIRERAPDPMAPQSRLAGGKCCLDLQSGWGSLCSRLSAGVNIPVYPFSVHRRIANIETLPLPHDPEISVRYGKSLSATK